MLDRYNCQNTSVGNKQNVWKNGLQIYKLYIDTKEARKKERPLR